MKAHRFFIKPEEKSLEFGQKTIIYGQAIIHQFRHVLRLQPSEKIILLDNTGYEFEAAITAMNEKTATVHILSKKKNENEPKQTVVLYQAMPKKAELFEMILQKGTEIGVKKFVPLITARTERKSLPKRERLERILREAAEQSERGIIPELSEPLSLRASELFQSHGRRSNPNKLSSYVTFLFDSSGEPFPKTTAQEIHLFVGPEGGFTDEEIALAEKSEVSVISLGNRILRTETAGIVIPALFLIP